MLFSSPDDTTPLRTIDIQQRLLSAFDRVLCTQFRAPEAFPSIL
jgi:hypothetical protein